EDLTDVVARMNAEQAKTEDIRPDSDFTLAELFVKYCKLKSKVTVIDQYGSDHKVSHQFFYKYGNSQYDDESVLYEEQPRRSDGFKISKKFFIVANEKFCETYYMFKAYKDNDFVDIKKDCNSLVASFASTSIGTAIQIGVNVLHLIFGGFAAKVIAGYVIALLSANAVVLGIE
ncbi:MAG: hypothetical protein MJ201_05565, partial [Mycoplasmoidaceae bacterium]|nr:hypothetical protein [Mycoplasmoidaceae bacterium]